MKDNHLERFDEIAKQLCELHRKKDAAYGNSFGETFKKLGIVSAATRLSDKFNRFINLVTHKGVDTLGESIKDTLMDMAAYCIMTLVEMEDKTDMVGKIFVCERTFRDLRKNNHYVILKADDMFFYMYDGVGNITPVKRSNFNKFFILCHEQGNKNNGDSQD